MYLYSRFYSPEFNVASCKVFVLVNILAACDTEEEPSPMITSEQDPQVSVYFQGHVITLWRHDYGSLCCTRVWIRSASLTSRLVSGASLLFLSECDCTQLTTFSATRTNGGVVEQVQSNVGAPAPLFKRSLQLDDANSFGEEAVLYLQACLPDNFLSSSTSLHLKAL